MPVLRGTESPATSGPTDLPQRIFSPIARDYDRPAMVLSLFQYRRWHRFLLSRLDLAPGPRVLDMATGTGAIALDLLGRTDAQVIGADVTRPMLLRAQARADGRFRGRVSLVECTAEAPPFAAESFDAITFAYLFRYVGDVPATLRDLARLLRPGGTMASLDFAVPRGVWYPLWRLYTAAVLPVGGRFFSREWRDVGAFLGPSIRGFYRRWPEERLLESWRDAGFADVQLAAALAGWSDSHLGDEERVKLWARGVVSDASAEHLSSTVDGARPAFYALEHGGWRDYVTLLHPPYTLWHLSYVVLGAALSPTLREDRLAATLIAFFLAVGVSAHAFDELNGRPLRTRIPNAVLVTLGIGGLAGAIAIGLAGAVLASPWLLVFVAFGAFIAPAYNLEWFRGRFHSDFWFAAAWGVFPFLTAYWASAEQFELSAAFGAAAVFALSLAQRTLSRRVRAVRRQARSIEGRVVYADGTVEDIDRRWAIAADEHALMLMAVATVAISLGVLLLRV